MVNFGNEEVKEDKMFYLFGLCFVFDWLLQGNDVAGAPIPRRFLVTTADVSSGWSLRILEDDGSSGRLLSLLFFWVSFFFLWVW